MYSARNEELHSAKEGRNILHTMKRTRAKWIGHIFVGTVF